MGKKMVPVSSENEIVWANMCVDLWPEGHTVESFLKERSSGQFKNDFLCIEGNEYIGFVSLSIRNDYVEGTDSNPVGYIEGIYVIPEYRKQGVARSMIEFAKNWSKEKGCKQMASDCLIENSDSHIFHNKTGFKEANTIVCFVMDIID